MPLIDVSSIALPGTGDAVPGSGGMTTSSRANQTVLQAYNEDELGAGANSQVVAPALHGTLFGQAAPWWIALAVLLVVLKFVAEKGGEGGEFKNIRIGFFNVVVITVSAIVGLTITKWVFGIYVVPGLSAIVEAA